MTARGFVGVFLVFLLTLGGAAAQSQPLPVDEAFALEAERTAEGIQLTWQVAPGYYLYRDHFEITSGGTTVPFTASAGEVKADPLFGTVEVIFDEAVVTAEEPAGSTLSVTYQGCQDDGICYPPETRDIDVDAMAFAAAAPTQPGAAGPGGSVGEGASSLAGTIQIAGDGGTAFAILGGGNALWVAAAFLGFGLLLAFTPCVFPMYPIVVGMLGRQGKTASAKRGFLLSAVYVTALAAAFGLVGAIVGWTGQNLQLALQSPVTTGVIAGLFILLALAMSGLFEIRLPSALTSRLGSSQPAGGGTVGQAAVLGFTSALIVGPCVTAPLAGALVYIGQGGDWRLGATALFALGIGKGLPLVAMATFGAGLLPRAGPWMQGIKYVFGFGFLAMAVWIAAPLLPPGADLGLYAVLLAGAAMLVFRMGAGSRTYRNGLAASTLSILALVLGAGGMSGERNPVQAFTRIVQAAPAEPAGTLQFAEVETRDELIAEFGEAHANNQPIMVYVTAEWCVICRTIEGSILPHGDVIAALDGHRLVKLDVTDLNAENRGMMEELQVAGPPTMMFFGPDGREFAGTRLIGSVTPGELASAAKQQGAR